ncbi:MAG: Mut7-C ubiquitin/RNAse domain-containing protein [Chloroflexi bacterium]|nr:Mut7-C ubiquitin/RNAse domain-containing protein [Chloroflexota bacterium]
MMRVSLRFYAELNDFLPPERRMVEFEHLAADRASVKDVIESAGVPHAEVDLILVNGVSVDFAHPVSDGDRISVYPVFESLDITPVIRLRPRPLRNPRFILDTHLGRLATYLRMLGFDSLYRNDYDDAEIARIACDENRIILTRDKGLLMRNAVTHGYWVRATRAEDQTVEVIRRFDLAGQVRPFSRCIVCNQELRPVAKGAIADRLPPKTRQYYEEFSICDSCGRIYWNGSHYERMRRTVDWILSESRGGEGR